ncbi:MAG TPA: COR domain-containing protein, partial [Saprospiraceae bacterium]|nr:COR domain-containing protein [Saprospiraceae bacterium]
SDASFLEKLSKLTSLDLSYNPISDWSFLQKLSKLTSLDLSGNPISDARFLQKLSKLRRIVLYDNHVADLSPLLFFIKEKGLQVVSKPWYKTKDGEINIGGNPLSTPPLEIVQQGNAAIIRYFEEKARLEKAPDAQPALIKVREAKVLLVGQGKSGKTTLRRKLEDPDAAMPEPGDSTRGIEITRLDERMPHTGDALRLNLWDFGGQDIQHYAHQFFLTGSSLYVLVTNERIQDGVHLPYWLNIIELLGKKSPVVIVQNMDGGHCQPLKDEAAIRARFANVHNRTFQSDFSKAKIEPAFSALRKKIVELAAELPHIEREYLRSFNDLRQKLEAEAVHPTHYLRWDDYLALMPELGEDLMRDYANALTFLGVCQYFPHDALLSQYVFLRPKWLIDALFELLLHSHFEKTRGTFAESDTFHIWQGEAYRGMHALLVRMMKEFELCYLVADNEEKYIVPQRLPGENKSYGWNSTGDVPVQYRYKFMPKGILTRLICRLHPRIEKDSVLGQRVWNDAVIFTLPDGKGRVFAREVYSENIIELRAEVIKHAEMLNEVIRKMDDINADTKYDNLQVEKMVPCPCAECAIAESPGFHEFDALQKRIEKGKPTSECKRSGEDVPIDEIFGKSGVTKPKRHRDELANPFETRPSVPKPLKAFFSYSKQDYENYLAPLLDYLNPLVKSRLFAPWHNRQILPGEDWDDRIQAEIEQADIIFLLVSTHSLNTDYIWNVEIEAAMRRHEAGTAKVVPIILSKCLWEETDQEGNYIFPPAKLNALPTKGKPVSEWSSREDAWDEVSKGVKELCKQISAQL